MHRACCCDCRRCVPIFTCSLQNLLIGVIGDVYQNKASIQSVEQWERHITQLMETSAVERRRAAVHTSVRRLSRYSFEVRL